MHAHAHTPTHTYTRTRTNTHTYMHTPPTHEHTHPHKFTLTQAQCTHETHFGQLARFFESQSFIQRVCTCSFGRESVRELLSASVERACMCSRESVYVQERECVCAVASVYVLFGIESVFGRDCARIVEIECKAVERL